MVQMKLKNSLTYNMTTLYREVNARVRYYKIRTYLTLFGEYLLIRNGVGGIDNKQATREKQSYFATLNEVIVAVDKILILKHKRGYL